jgi:hypothetical protein
LEQKEIGITVFVSITAEGEWSMKVLHKVVVSWFEKHDKNCMIEKGEREMFYFTALRIAKFM